MGQPASGTPPPVSPPLEPEYRGRQLLLDPKLHRLDGTKSEGRTGLLHSYDSAEDVQRQTVRIRPKVPVKLREIYDRSYVVYLCSLLMQSFSQVSNALIHHGHLDVPLVQQLLVLGQLAALLQVMTVSSLRHTALQALKLHFVKNDSDQKSLNVFIYRTKEVMGMYHLPAAPGRVSSAPGLQDQTELILCGQWVHPGTRLVPPDLVQWSVAEGVLSSNPPTAESTGKNHFDRT